jgi:hypothetical protein
MMLSIRGVGMVCVLAALVLGAARARAEEPAADAEGFVPMFNGKDLTGWEGNDKLWFAENGEVVGKSPGIKKNEFLASTADYGDFVMKFSFRIVNNPSGDANSGMQFRSQRVPNSTEMSGYQADVGQGYWGCLYDESRRRKVLVKPSPEDFAKAVNKDGWNDYTISCKGTHIELTLNGVVTAVWDEPEPEDKAARTGKFGLQIHAGGPMEVHVKNARIKVLK